MNILVLSSRVPTLAEGSGTHLFNQLRLLSKRGHDITLVTLEEKNYEAKFPEELNSYCKDIRLIKVPENKSLSRNLLMLANMLSPQHVFSKNHTLFNRTYSLTMHREIRNLLKTGNFDLIYAYALETAFYAWDSSLPKVVNSENAMNEEYLIKYREARSPIDKITYRILFHSAERETKYIQKKRFDGLIVVSPFDRSRLEHLVPGYQITVNPLGVDIDYFRTMSAKPDFPSLVFIGKLRTEAIIFFCQKIYPLIKTKFPDVKFYAMGVNTPEVIKQFASDKSIIFTGYVEDIRPYMAKASVVVIPMPNQTGMSNKVLEAMAMGKPVVSTSVSTRGIDIHPGDDIFEADDPADFADKVCQLLGNEEQRNIMGRKARQTIERLYSWDKNVDVLEDMFFKAIQKYKATN